MKLYFKQQPFAWGERLEIINEAQALVLSAEGEVFDGGALLHLYDAKGEKVAQVRQQLLSWRPRYHIEVKGKEVGILLQRYAMVGTRYDIDLLSWTTRGNWGSELFEVVDHSRIVMTVTPAAIAGFDGYLIDIAVKNDLLPAVCIGLTINFSLAAELHHGVG